MLWKAYLFEGVIELTQDVFLIEDFALVPVFVVVMDFLPHVCWKLVEGHVLLHLFVLKRWEIDKSSKVNFLSQTRYAALK